MLPMKYLKRFNESANDDVITDILNILVDDDKLDFEDVSANSRSIARFNVNSSADGDTKHFVEVCEDVSRRLSNEGFDVRARLICTYVNNGQSYQETIRCSGENIGQYEVMVRDEIFRYLSTNQDHMKYKREDFDKLDVDLILATFNLEAPDKMFVSGINETKRYDKDMLKYIMAEISDDGLPVEINDEINKMYGPEIYIWRTYRKEVMCDVDTFIEKVNDIIPRLEQLLSSWGLGITVYYRETEEYYMSLGSGPRSGIFSKDVSSLDEAADLDVHHIIITASNPV